MQNSCNVLSGHWCYLSTMQGWGLAEASFEHFKRQGLAVGGVAKAMVREIQLVEFVELRGLLLRISQLMWTRSTAVRPTAKSSTSV